MRTCGGCTLCCKLPFITELNKPTNTWCRHCDIGVGCKIYSDRPESCRKFECQWLIDETLPDEMRPDKAHLYAKQEGEVFSIYVDKDYPDAWRKDVAGVVNLLRDRGHLLIVVDNQITFLCGRGKDKPAKLIVDWLM